MDERDINSSGTLDRDHDQFGFEASVQSQLERVNGGELFDREKRAIGRHFTDRGAKTLDVGCGVGRVSCALDARGFDVTGIDISGELIQAAQSHFSGIEFLVSDAATLPFSDNSFEYVIFAYNGIDYLLPEQRRREALREIRRVIRPSGVFIFSSHNSWYTFPAVLRDQTFVKNRYLSTKNRDRFFSRYKFENAEVGWLKTYFTNPVRQWRELRTVGFNLVDVIGRQDFPLWLFETSPYYVTEPA